MAKGSDNPFPSVLVVEGTTPTSPASGDQRVFIDSADHKLKRVNSSGSVTTIEGSTSSFIGCRVYNSTDQNITDATATALSFDSERIDTDTMHEGVTHPTRITITTAGKYIIWGGVAWDNASSTGYRNVDIRLNGTTLLARVLHNAATSTFTMQTISTGPYDFSATDYVELVVTANSGGTRTIKAFGNYSPEFGATKVG